LYFTKEFRDEGFTGQKSGFTTAMEKFIGSEKPANTANTAMNPGMNPANPGMQNGMNPAMNTGTKY